MGPLVLRPLEHERIRQAFPLVQSVLPNTSLLRWTEFARGQIPEGKGSTERGIVVAENQPGYIVGLFTHQTRDELALGRTLAIGNLLVPDFPGREQAVAYVIDGIEVMANLRGCNAVTVDLDIAFADGTPTSGWSLPIFERNNFLAIGASQCRKLFPARRRGFAPFLQDAALVAGRGNRSRY